MRGTKLREHELACAGPRKRSPLSTARAGKNTVAEFDARAAEGREMTRHLLQMLATVGRGMTAAATRPRRLRAGTPSASPTASCSRHRLRTSRTRWGSSMPSDPAIDWLSRLEPRVERIERAREHEVPALIATRVALLEGRQAKHEAQTDRRFETEHDRTLKVVGILLADDVKTRIERFLSEKVRPRIEHIEAAQADRNVQLLAALEAMTARIAALEAKAAARTKAEVNPVHSGPKSKTPNTEGKGQAASPAHITSNEAQAETKGRVR